MRQSHRAIGRAAGLAALALLTLTSVGRATDSDALWRIVHGQCAMHEETGAGPAPCEAVSLTGGWAVLKDRRGATQFLLIPTARVTGIEDPAVLAPTAPNYWAAAWAARGLVAARAGHDLPRDALSLAINSPYGRSQNQLHIHIDCLRPDVRDALDAHEVEIGTAWMAFPVLLAGHRYIARRLDDAALGEADPFRLLAEAPQVGEGGIGAWTLVVAGATFPGIGEGFLLLADRVDAAAGDRANGEELQDHDCALAKTPPN